MKLIPNVGNDRVIDELRACLAAKSSLDIASSALSLFAFAEMRELLEAVDQCRIVLPASDDGQSDLLGNSGDRPFRNRLVARWLAKECRDWIDRKVDVREVSGSLP